MNTYDSEITVETKSVDEALNKLRQLEKELDSANLALDLLGKGAEELCKGSFGHAVTEQIMTAAKNATAENTKKRSGMMENQGPIMEFGNIEQAYKCLNEWQKRLFLDDWTIMLSLVGPEEMKDADGEVGDFNGTNSFVFSVNACHIRLLIPDDEDTRGRIQKFCHEQTLIHELLHCKYCWLEAPYSHEGKYLNEVEHALLEQMSKSLLMAKYNLPFEWFKNF